MSYGFSHSNQKIVFSLIFTCLIFLISLNTYFVHAREDYTQLVFEKKMVTKNIKGKDILFEEHTVQPGEHIWKILRGKGFSKDKLLQQQGIVQEGNKWLEDKNLIYPGQKIFIPVVKDQSSEAVNELSKPLKEKDLLLINHTVKGGDTLYDLLKSRGMTKKMIFNKYIELFMKLNPETKDPNILITGKKIIIPCLGANNDPIILAKINKSMASNSDKITPIEKENSINNILDQENFLEDNYITKEDVLSDENKDEEIIPEKENIITDFNEANESEIKDNNSEIIIESVLKILKSAGFRIKTAGKTTLPLDETVLEINASISPLISMPNGVKIILDKNHKLTPDIRGQINKKWSTYKVIDVNTNNIKLTLDKIFNTASMQAGVPNEPLIKKGNPTLDIKPDYIISKDASYGYDGEVSILFFITDPKDRTSSSIMRLLKTKDILALDILDQGILTPVKIFDYNSVSDTKVLNNIKPAVSSGLPLVEAILTACDVVFTKHVSIPVFMKDDNKPLYIVADMLLQINGQKYIIDLGTLSNELIGILSKYEFKILSITNDMAPWDVIEQTALLLDSNININPRIKILGKANGNEIYLNITGIFITNKDKQILATPLNLDTDLENVITGYGIIQLIKFNWN